MYRGAVLWLVVALVAALAIGSSAATLDTTLSSGPEEALNLDLVPFGDSLEERYHRVTASTDEPDPADPTGEDADTDQETDTGADTEDEQDEERAAGGEPDREGDGGGEEMTDGAGDGLAADMPLDEDGPLAWLWSRLRLLLLGLLLAGLAALAVRERARLFPVLDRVDGSTADAPDPAPPLPVPHNPIEAAWLEVVRRLEPSDLDTMTAGEVAEAAIATGYNPDAVRTITHTFEEVEYGQQPVDDERIERARTSLQLLLEGRSGK